MYRTFGLLLISYLLTPPLFAATADQSTGLLTVHHNEGFVDVTDGGGRLISRDQLKNGLSYRIRPNETVDISIDDPNPLLYTYEWKLGALKNSDNFDAISRFANAINPALGLLQQLTGVPSADSAQFGDLGTGCEAPSTAEIRAICGAGVDKKMIRRYAQQYDELLEFSQKIPQWIKSSAGSKSAAAEVKVDVLKHNAVTNASQLAADIKKIKSARNARAAALKAAAFPVRARPILLASLYPEAFMIALAQAPQSSTGTGGALPASGSSGGGSQPNANLQEEIDRLEARVKELEATDAQNPDEIELAQNFSVILPTIDDAEKTLAALDAFVGLVKKINAPILLGTLPYNARQVQPATLTIKPVPANKGSVDPEVKDGDFAFSFQAFNPVNYYVDAGPVYSFIEAPEFGT
jgi:hypothetical protein